MLTSLDVDSLEAISEVIDFYFQRQRLEDYFRVLKFSCQTEYLAFSTTNRLQHAIATNTVIA